MVFAGFYFNREAVATRSLDYLVKDYYENYFYDSFAANGYFERYAQNGFARISLRQLLSFDRARNGSRAGDFYECDKERTMVKIMPVKPFGRTDYTVETLLDCKR